MTIVSDNGANMRKAREIIQTKYLCIKNIRCISHYINLISCDIIQHSFANKILKKVNILASFLETIQWQVGIQVKIYLDVLLYII